jgi:hypothetical protein
VNGGMTRSRTGAEARRALIQTTEGIETMRKTLSAVFFGLLLVITALGGTVAAADPGMGTVTVVHGVPGLTVDVYVNNQLTLPNFAPGTVTDPLSLPAGDYTIDIRPAGAAADSAPAISGKATLAAGANVTIEAHLTADGKPTLSVFSNGTSALEAGTARLVVRHTAAAPAVDILADGSVLFSNLSNPNEASADVPAGSYGVTIAPTGTTDVVFDAGTLKLEAGTAYFVYAYGSLSDNTFALAIQTIGNLGPSAPSGGDMTAPAQPKAGCAFFDQTKHNACAGFAAYWTKFGGLPVFGYPITEEFQMNGMTVQYFERARMEWHPGSDAAHYDVVLGRVGSELAASMSMNQPFQPAAETNSQHCTFFAQTSHNACNGFRAYWLKYGGLSTFGYPISEEFTQDGKVVQYFERARFEWVPGSSAPRFDVVEGRVGAELLAMH